MRLHRPTVEIEEVNLDKPAKYRITVKGVIPESWLDRLGGLKMTAAAMGKTTLAGHLPDQAALHGVLDTLYDLNLPLLTVTSHRQLNQQKGDPSNEKLHQQQGKA